MRLRCPAKNCPIDVPDDLVGQRIHCPHCGHELVVDPKYRDAPSPDDRVDAIQPGLPDMTLDSATEMPKTPPTTKLENQIYDGLPPLSVMIALRRQQGVNFDKEEMARRYPLSEDDMRALSAFESVLYAAISCRTTLIVGALGFVVNGFLWWIFLPSAESATALMRSRALGQGALLLALFACCPLVYVGNRALERIRLDYWATLLPWAAFGIALVGGGGVMLNVLAIADQSHQTWMGCAAVLSLPFNVLILLDSAKSAWRSGQSLGEISPPEISHRLIEALRYLE